MRTEVNGKEIFVFVPPGYRWFASLYAALRRFELPVFEMTLSPGLVKVSFLFEDQQTLALRVTDRAPETAAWKNTKRLSVRYDGNSDINETAQTTATLFLKILSKYESAIPSPIEGHCHIGPANRPPKIIMEEMFPFVTVEESSANNTLNSEILIRLTSQCNLNCPFCSRPHHGPPTDEAVFFLLDTVSQLIPDPCVSFTGGEPTLRASFLKYVERALEMTAIKEVQIQTNAINFAEQISPSIFPVSDKLSFFVSLHSLDADIYHRCVGSADTLARAISGIHRILDAGHSVTLNTVVCRHNIDSLGKFVEDVAREFDGANKPTLHFSTLICQEWNEHAPASLVRYADVLPVLQIVHEKMEEFGFATDGHLSSTHAAMPVCLLRDSRHREAARMPRNIDHETGYEDYSKPWIKAKRCLSCATTHQCLGVPRAYAQKYGLDELGPILIRRDGTP